MSALSGTWRLTRLALRRDRVKLPLVLAVLSLVFMATIGEAITFYGGSQEQQLSYARTNAASVVGRVFNGPVDGPDMGAIVLNETFLFTAIAVAFMSTLTVVRHTRQNEEFGRSELIESGIVARHASLAAALSVAIIANIAFGGLATLALLARDLPAVGSVGTGAAFAVIGITFAAIAAVAAQLADSARGANSFSAIAIGIAFLLRTVGDGIGTVTADGLSVTSTFPSWLSPLGWAQQIFPYTDRKWWIFGLSGGLFAVALGTAMIFMAKRDIGMGMIATKPGPAKARPNLLSPFGLARRLQRGTLRGWAATIVMLGVVFGLVIKDFESFLSENEQIRETFNQFGSGAGISDVFLSIVLNILSIMIAGYAIQSLLRLRSEEAGGQAEFILGTGVSRSSWQLSHIAYAGVGIVLLSALSGLSIGPAYVLSTGGSWGELGSLMGAAFAYSTAIFALAGFVIMLISIFPKLAVAASWTSFATCLLIVQFGLLLKLPQWVMNLSPFGHLSAMPAQDFKLAPVIWLLAITGVLLAVSLLYFNRRDIVTS